MQGVTVRSALNGNSYVLQEELGQGGTGSVHAAVVCDAGGLVVADSEPLAIKFILLVPDETHLRRVKREVIALNRLRHPHVIPMRDLVMTHNYPVASQQFPYDPHQHVVLPAIGIVMDRANIDLQQYINSLRDQGTTLGEHVVRWVFQQLMLAVDYCHTMGISQRDCKPGNILLFQDPQTNAIRAKLADFGWARPIELATAGPATPDAGTRLYRAPEMGAANQYDPRQLDVWSCGVVLFHMLFPNTFYSVREGPHAAQGTYINWLGVLAAPRPEGVDNPVSPSCRDLLVRMLQVHPIHRATMQQVLAHPWFLQSLPEDALQLNIQAQECELLFVEPELRAWLTETILQCTSIAI